MPVCTQVDSTPITPYFTNCANGPPSCERKRIALDHLSETLRSRYASRGMLAALATASGFVVANVFCWLMNRWFVFTPGKYKWHIELAMFFGVSTAATLMALGVMKVLIDQFAIMTTVAVVVEIVVSFFVNFFMRKFVIFKG